MENKRVVRARETATLALAAEESNRKLYEDATAKYNSLLNELENLKSSIHEHALRTKQLRVELPFEAEDIQHLEKSLELSVRAQRQAESETRFGTAKKLNKLA